MSDSIITKGTTVSKSDVLVEVDGNNLVVVVDITAGDGTLDVTIEGVTSSGYVYPLLESETLTGVSTTPLRIFPGATPSENAVANVVVPRNVQVSVVVTGTVTYGVDAFSED